MLRCKVVGRRINIFIASADVGLKLCDSSTLGCEGPGKLLVLASEIIDPALHSSTFTLRHGNVAFDGTKLNVMLLDSGGMLIDQSCVVHSDFIKLSLHCNLLCLDDIEGLSELLLAVQCLSVLRTKLLQLCLKIPVFLLIAILTLIERLEALLKSLGFKLKPSLVGLKVFVLFISLGQYTLKIADLSNKRSADFGSELDIVNSV
jgi:hypothetical protein